MQSANDQPPGAGRPFHGVADPSDIDASGRNFSFARRELAALRNSGPILSDVSSEDAVRMYLQYLADPTKLVDQASVKKLESDVDKAKDPIDKLKAVAALERARAVDGQQHEDAFIRNARAWADAEGIPLAAFKTMGVPDAVLARAGFDDGRRRGGRSRSAAKRATTRSGRAKSTSADAIREWVLATAGTFTLADVQKGIGGSPATIKKAIDELIEADKVENLGAAAEHHGRGRAPYHYTLKR